MSKSFRELEVWQRSHRLVLEVYRVTSSFPKDERFGTVLNAVAQMMPALGRALKSKMANGAGTARGTGHGARATRIN